MLSVFVLQMFNPRDLQAVSLHLVLSFRNAAAEAGGGAGRYDHERLDRSFRGRGFISTGLLAVTTRLI